MSKFKKGDNVQIVCGKDKGKSGLIKLIDGDYIFVEGINISKRHKKPNQESKGGIFDVESKLHISNVMHLDPKSKKVTRIRFKQLENGKKIRVSCKSGEKIEQ